MDDHQLLHARCAHQHMPQSATIAQHIALAAHEIERAHSEVAEVAIRAAGQAE